MTLAHLGAIGLGLVWGWLLGTWNAPGRGRRPWLNGLLSALTSLPLSLLTGFFAGWRGAFFFLIPAFISLVIHLAWLSILRSRVTT